MGIMVHDMSQEEHFQKLAEIGFNTLQLSCEYSKLSYKINPENMPKQMALAEKYNMQVILWGGIGAARFPKINQAKERFKQLLPEMHKVIDNIKDYKNLLMYFNVDEPNLRLANTNVKLMKWYEEEIEKLDPYHPMYINFSKHIPKGDEWTRWGGALSDDIYIRPWTGFGLLSKPGIGTAYYANKIKMRCEKDHKIMFMVHLAGQHSVGKGPVGNTNQQMLCQNYTSLIYGAKGIIFFLSYNSL